MDKIRTVIEVKEDYGEIQFFFKEIMERKNLNRKINFCFFNKCFQYIRCEIVEFLKFMTDEEFRKIVCHKSMIFHFHKFMIFQPPF